MDVIAYLWSTAAGEGGASVMAHALSTPAVRDGLLRQAAITNGWDQLRGFAAAAGEIAEQEGWSRAGPDVVAAICQWIHADRLLRSVPAHDRAARLAGATLGGWSNPGQVAAAIADSEPLSEEAGRAFNESVIGDRQPGAAADVMAELEDAMSPDPTLGDPDLIAFACNQPLVRAALLRDAARSGRWADLAEAADAAADAARAAGTFDAGPRTTAALARWMLDDPAAARELEVLRDADPFAAAVLDSGVDPLDLADRWAHAPRLPEAAARVFADAAAPAPDLMLVHGPGGDPLRDDAEPSPMLGGPVEGR